MFASDDTPPPPGAVHELAEETVAFVRRALSIVLDYRSETLPVLDHYLGGVPRDQPETVRLVAATAGAYFGEVARRALGGEWRIEDEAAPSTWRLELPGIAISPVGFAAGAILGADTEEYDGSFEVSAADRAAVETALEGREVPEDEYYSLSGRLETLCYVADVIAARRLQAERADDEPNADDERRPDDEKN